MSRPTLPTDAGASFDRNSGSVVERLLFNNRLVIVIVCALITGVLGFSATRVRLNASFEQMIPPHHPYIVNYFRYKQDLSAQGNAVRIAVATNKGTIFDAKYIETLRQINDEVFLIPGVDRPYMKSLWTPATRWTAVTEEGLDGGPVMPNNYDGSAQSIARVRSNVERSGEIGQLVAADYKSSVIFVPLLEIDTQTGQRLDYGKFSVELERIRQKYERGAISIHITGFAKLVGDLIDGLREILAFFAVTLLLAALTLYWFTRCLRSTFLVVTCSLVAVVWQLGLLPLLGYTLNPYSILVPFLVFAIGMSHGAQKMNGIMRDIGRGLPRLFAARLTFRRLFLAALTALLCDAVGFAVLVVIDIPVIKAMAIIASLGVAILIFTNLILLPVLLSYVGVDSAAAVRSLGEERAEQAAATRHPLWRFLDLFTQRKWAATAIAIATVMGVVGFVASLNLKIGDLDPGAPELRTDSRYNRDNALMNASYAASSDILVAMVATPPGKCLQYQTQLVLDSLGSQLDQVPGVIATNSIASFSKLMVVGLSEGFLKWYYLVPTQSSLNAVRARAPRELLSQQCDVAPLFVYLQDHKAETLSRVITEIEAFAAQNDTADVHVLLASGNAGIEAATNIVVKRASREMLFLVYGAVIALGFLTFLSWRAMLAAVLPLVLISILCEALMVVLGIGVKVATLPVIALGVGIGVDYALYVATIMLAHLREGATLSEAYYRALLFTGRVVILTGVTLAAGVATWVFSEIKFQADMGLLLAFMFLGNMVAALILLPAISCFLLHPSKPQTVPAGAGASP